MATMSSRQHTTNNDEHDDDDDNDNHHSQPTPPLSALPQHEQQHATTNTTNKNDDDNNFLTLLQNAIHNPDQLTAMISNYSTSYNAVNVGIVLPVLKYSLMLSSEAANGNGGGGDGEYSSPQSGGESVESAVWSSMARNPFIISLSSSKFSILAPLKHISFGILHQLLNVLQLFPSLLSKKQHQFHSLGNNTMEQSVWMRQLFNNDNATTTTTTFNYEGYNNFNDFNAFNEYNNLQLQQENQDEEDDSIVASSLLAGMILGQLIGGYLGDVLGRRNAMLLVMILQIGGSLGGAVFIRDTSGDGDGLSALEQLALWRFVLGIGAGGVYPLAAVMSAENKGQVEGGKEGRDDEGMEDGSGARGRVNNDSTNGDNEDEDEEEEVPTNRIRHRHHHGYTPTANNETHNIHNNESSSSSSSNNSSSTNNSATIPSFQRIALTFSTQGLGFLTVPLLAYPMLELQWNVDFIWRVLLGVGALPGLVVLYLRLGSGSGTSCCKSSGGRRGQQRIDDDDDPAVAAGVSKDDNSNGNGSHHTKATSEKIEGGAFGDKDFTNNMKQKTHQRIEAGSLELTTPHPISAGDEEEPSLQYAVSSLFSGDILDSIVNPPVVDHNENELSLVEHSHLDCNDGNDDERDENNGIGSDSLNADTVPQLQQQPPPGLWASIKKEPNLGRKFAGTAGTWFLFDVLFYGNTLFEPLVLEAAFGTANDAAADDGYSLLQTTVRDSLIVSLISLPGYFVTVMLIGRRTCSCQSLRLSSSSSTRCGSCPCFPCYQTPAYIQMQGFLLMFLLYLTIGLFWKPLSEIQWLLLLLYGGTFFFANYGPNTTTFLLPSVTYSEECRSTLNGFSAAAGKMGALVGASVFAPAAEDYGESTVMVFCACVSLVAWGLTKVCVGRAGHDRN